jgi:hypothetical protein
MVGISDQDAESGNLLLQDFKIGVKILKSDYQSNPNAECCKPYAWP